MDPIAKMYLSLIAIVLMFVCNFMMIYARKLQNAFLSMLLKIFAFILLLVVLFMIIAVLLF